MPSVVDARGLHADPSSWPRSETYAGRFPGKMPIYSTLMLVSSCGPCAVVAHEQAVARLTELQTYGVLVAAPFRFSGSGMPTDPPRGLEPAGRMLSCGMTPTFFLLEASVLVCAFRVALESPVCSAPSWVLPLTPPFEPVCTWGLCESHDGVCNLAPLRTRITKLAGKQLAEQCLKVT